MGNTTSPIAINYYTKYVGETKNNVPHGTGIITYNNGVSIDGTFIEGELVNEEIRYEYDKHIFYEKFLAGFINGKNLTYITNDCNILIGNFIRGQLSGKGTIKNIQGDEYTGIFENNHQLNGQCVKHNGTVLKGTFTNGRLTGKGEIIYHTGTIHTGIFAEDKLLIGKKICTNGSIYEGEFYNNGCIRKGKLMRKDGFIFEGEFNKNGIIVKGKVTQPNNILYDGYFDEKGVILKGKKILPDGVVYEGEFKKGGVITKIGYVDKQGIINEIEFEESYLCGEGKATYPNGIYLQGTFHHDKLNGDGVYVVDKRREVCEGEFANGKKHGLCKIWRDNKLIADGQFINNKQISGLKYDYTTNGKIIIRNFDECIIEVTLANKIYSMDKPPITF